MRYGIRVVVAVGCVLLGAVAGYFAAGVRWGEFSLAMLRSDDLSDAQVLLKMVDLLDADDVALARFRMLAIAKAASEPLPEVSLPWHERAVKQALLVLPLDRSVERYVAEESNDRAIQVEARFQRICGKAESSSERYGQICRR